MTKKPHYLLLVLLLVVLSCKKQESNREKEALVIDDNDTKEIIYTDNQFRRFTYFFKSDNPEVLEFFESKNWKKNIVHETIYDFNIYRKESDFFMVIDSDPSFDSKKLFEVLNQKTDFQILKKQIVQAGVSFPPHHMGLERIYKLDQKVMYTPQEGQLKTKIGSKKRFVWTLLLQEDPKMMEAYKKIHGIGQAWPEITSNMKSIGVRDMEIYLYHEQAILIMDTNPEFDLDAVGPKWQKLPRENEWQEYVAKYQRTTPGSSISEKWLDMNVL